MSLNEPREPVRGGLDPPSRRGWWGSAPIARRTEGASLSADPGGRRFRVRARTCRERPLTRRAAWWWLVAVAHDEASDLSATEPPSDRLGVAFSVVQPAPRWSRCGLAAVDRGAPPDRCPRRAVGPGRQSREANVW